ncbi:interleukin-6 [Diretmus argenteus]
MPSSLNAYLLRAVVLAALASGVVIIAVPVGTELTDNLSDDPSGDEQEAEAPPDPLSAARVWGTIIAATQRHKKQFEDEFQNSVKYDSVKDYKIPSPQRCPSLNFSKEACLRRLVQGLLKFSVLLKHVEKEYPTNSFLPEVKSNSGSLVTLIKEKMKHPNQVTALTGSQEEQLLKELDNPDTFRRKMTAYSILYQFHWFLVDGQRAGDGGPGSGRSSCRFIPSHSVHVLQEEVP